jgi:hypothetical protein
MAVPASRIEFKDYCKRRLGYPVVDINVDDGQIEDRIDDALRYYQDYHMDGTEKLYLKHVITQSDKDNEYISLPEAITGITNIFDIGDSLNTSNLFNIRYQIHLNDLFDFTSSSYINYVSAMRHVAQLEELFVGKKPIRFNRHTDKLFIEMDWDSDILVGEYIVIECYRYLDPNTYTDVWSDLWLKRYGTALIKKQWGENLKKFEGMTLPGNMQFNGQKIWEEAVEEVSKLEEEMLSGYSLPVSDLTG